MTVISGYLTFYMRLVFDIKMIHSSQIYALLASNEHSRVLTLVRIESQLTRWRRFFFVWFFFLCVCVCFCVCVCVCVFSQPPSEKNNVEREKV